MFIGHEKLGDHVAVDVPCGEGELSLFIFRGEGGLLFELLCGVGKQLDLALLAAAVPGADNDLCFAVAVKVRHRHLCILGGCVGKLIRGKLRALEGIDFNAPFVVRHHDLIKAASVKVPGGDTDALGGGER